MPLGILEAQALFGDRHFTRLRIELDTVAQGHGCAVQATCPTLGLTCVHESTRRAVGDLRDAIRQHPQGREAELIVVMDVDTFHAVVGD